MPKLKSLSIVIASIAVYFVLSWVFVGLFDDVLGSAVCADLAIFVLALLYLCKKTEQGSDSLFSFKRVSAPLGLGLLGMTLAVWIVAEDTGLGLYALFGDDTWKASLDVIRQSGVAGILFSVFIAPVAEEFLFRGVIFGTLRDSFGVLISAVISSVLFALCHGTLVQLPFCFLAGMLFCTVLVKTKSILWSVGAHVLFNVMAYVPFAGLLLSTEIPFWVCIVSFFATLLALGFLLLGSECNKTLGKGVDDFCGG